MANTTNFGWETPDDTDLVKDGAAAIRTLGSAIDTSMVDLKGGTSGQILSKNSNTDMDFLWTTPSTPSPSSWTLVNSGGTALTGAQTITVSGISGYNEFFIYVTGASSATSQSEISVRFNTDTASNYATFGIQNSNPTTYSATQNYGAENQTAISRIRMAQMANVAGSSVSGYLLVTGGNTSGIKQVNGAGGFNPSTGNSGAQYVIGGYWSGSATISSISLFSEFGNFDAGTIYIYGKAQ